MSATLARNNILYFTVATAGHVDHGKTSLLRALTGIDPDRLKEEKLRGLTTDLGFAHLTEKTGDGRLVKIGFVDVPGHGKFLKNMLAGVGGIDLALLVVAADEGPMPQSDQHTKILSLLGIKNVLLLITKIDLASGAQKQSAELRSKQLLAARGLNCLDCLFVSSTSKEGIDLIAPSLMNSLQSTIDRSEMIEELAYLPIDRVFSKTGYGTVITGTLVRGALSVGDNVYIEPGKLTARVRGMESFGKAVESAHAGQRLAVNLALKQSKSLMRGQAVFLSPPTECQNLIARFNLFPHERADDLMKSLPGQQVRVYHGTAEVPAQLRWLEIVECKTGGELVGQISLLAPLIAEAGEKFVIRYEDIGVTGGDILIGVRARWLSRKKLLLLLTLLLEQDYEAAIQLFIELSPRHMVKSESILAILPLSQRLLLSAQLLEGKLVALGEYITTIKSNQSLLDRIVEALERLHGEPAAECRKQTDEGIGLESLRTKTLGFIERSVFQALVKSLVESGRVCKLGDKVISSKFASQASDTRDLLNDRDINVLNVLEKQICLEVKEVARQVGLTVAEVESSVNHLNKKELGAIVAYEFASTMNSIDKAHSVLAALWQQKREITPSDFKEALGISRKFAMPLLTYFDDHNITRRTANNRVLLKAPRSKTP